MDSHDSAFSNYLKIIENIKIDKDKEMLFFRGVSNSNFKLKPGIDFTKSIVESDAYHSLLLEYPEEFNTKDHLGTLAKMQHYGLPTRLLDVTTNILIAAYFACEQQPDRDGKVTVFKVPKSEVLHHNSDRALMLACLPPLSEQVKKDIKNFCETNVGVITNQSIVGHPEMVKLLHEIRGEYPAFETAIVSEDILKCFFVQTNKNDIRIKSQSGFFVIFGLDDIKCSKYLESKKVKDIIINASEKNNILNTLELMNIHDDTVYPGLERTALYLRSQKLKRNNL